MDGERAPAPGSGRAAEEERHLSVRDVALLADDELAGEAVAESARIRAHVVACPACAARVIAGARLNATTSELLQVLDVPVPDVSLPSVIARAQRRRRPSYLRAAAAVVAFVGTAVTAAALPSSPFHRPVMRMLEAITPRRSPAARATGARPAPVPAQQRGGISVTPVQHLDVAFTQEQRSGTLHLVFADTQVATLSSTDSQASYQVGEDRIGVVNTGAGGNYELVIPRALRHVSVRIGTAVVFRRDGETVTATAPREPGGGYAISLTR